MADSVIAVKARPNGSWKWQTRYELVQYTVGYLTDGRKVWKRAATLDSKVTPRRMRELVAAGVHYGGLQNRLVEKN